MFVRFSLMACMLTIASGIANGQDTLPPGGQDGQQKQLSPEQYSQIVSYALGRSIAEDCQMGGVQIDIRALQTGVNEVAAGKPPQWKEAELNQVMHQFAMRVQQQVAANNKQRGEEFLTQNAKQPGVQVTPSGLQYKVLQNGNGATPTDGSVVVCHYTGSFTDGRVFESSRQAGQPAQFPVGRVIPGWTEALKMMKVGDKYQLFIPSDLAYGPQGHQNIGPNETLVFELELLQVGQPQPAPQVP